MRPRVFVSPIALVLLAALLAAATLLATGVIDVGLGRTAGRGEGATIAPPDSATASAPDAASLSGKPGARRAKRGAEASPPDPADLLPSEVAGTAKNGAVIKGRVVDGDAKVPVEGAIVRLTRPDSLFHYLRAKREGRYDDLTARTDAQGRFAFRDVVPADHYALLARRKGGAAATKENIRVASRQVVEEPDLVLGPSGGLGGRVVDGAGQPLADVRIAIAWEVRNEFNLVLADPDTLPWTEAETKSGADGRWSVKALEPGDKTIVFRGPSGAADVKTPITVTAGEQRDDVDFVLAGNLSLSGKVVWADGSPIAGARVLAGLLGSPSGHTVDTGADGTFSIGGLAPGSYVVGALVPGLPPVYDLEQKHEAGEKGVTFTFEAAGSLSGTVVAGPNLEPIERFRVLPVRVTVADTSLSARVMDRVMDILGPTAFESRDGVFRFDRLAGWTYGLVVEAEGHPDGAAPIVEVVPGRETSGVRVVLADGRRIAGRIVDEQGAPVPDADVSVEIDVRDLGDAFYVGTVAPDARSDATGAFETPPLSPGVYALTVEEDLHVYAVVRAIDLRSESKGDVVVLLHRGGKIRVRVLDHRGEPGPGISLIACAPSGESVTDSTDHDGACLTSTLAPGRWAVAWSSFALQRVLEGQPPPGAPPGTEPRELTPAQAYDAVRKADGMEVDVAAGGTSEATIRLPRLVRVTGRVRLRGEVPGGTDIYLAAPGLWGDRVHMNEDGTFTIERQEPGPFRATIWDGTAHFDKAVVIPDVAEYTLDIDFP